MSSIGDASATARGAAAVGPTPVGSGGDADPELRSRCEELAGRHGEAVGREVRALLGAGAGGGTDGGRDRRPGGVIEGPEVNRLVAAFQLRDARELALLALPAARALAVAPISGFRVGAVGVERGTGALVFGWNVEFPGGHLGMTIHAEGFVAVRATARGHGLDTLAVHRAQPCAHCRQLLAEFDWAAGLQIIDPLGHRRTLATLYPWAFEPAALGVAPAGGAAPPPPTPALAIADPDVPGPVAARLWESLRRAHAPYSGCPSAAVVQLDDGRLCDGAVIESVAFNPSILPLQAAVADVLAHGYRPDEIRAAWLAQPSGGSVDLAASSRELLTVVAPTAPLAVVDTGRGDTR
jgi:cytidine deaminase